MCIEEYRVVYLKDVNKLYRIAICDDEPGICIQLQEMLRACPDVPELDIVTFQSGETLCTAVERMETFDLFILDIELPSISGVDIGKKLRTELRQSEAQLLYISGKQDYAMQLFDLRPLNFLTKPLSEAKVQFCLKEAVHLSKDLEPCFVYKQKKGFYRIPFQKIQYFESRNKMVIIHTITGEESMTGQLAQVLEAAQIPETFIQVHQSFVVNYEYIKWAKYKTLTLEDGTELTISYSYRGAVQERLYTLMMRRRGAML